LSAEHVLEFADSGERQLKRLRDMNSRWWNPDVEESPWKYTLALLWIPTLLAVVLIGQWLQIPQAIEWLIVLVFCFGYGLAAWHVFRRSGRSQR
jgi:hypothetical protein